MAASNNREEKEGETNILSALRREREDTGQIEQQREGGWQTEAPLEMWWPWIT